MRPLRRLQAAPGQCDRLDGRRCEVLVAVDQNRQSRFSETEILEEEVGLG